MLPKTSLSILSLSVDVKQISNLFTALSLISRSNKLQTRDSEDASFVSLVKSGKLLTVQSSKPYFSRTPTLVGPEVKPFIELTLYHFSLGYRVQEKRGYRCLSDRTEAVKKGISNDSRV